MESGHSQMQGMMENHYRNLWILALLSFISMYILMYAMVNSLENVFNNVNELYMAGLVIAPIIPIEIFLMRSMYKHQKRNILIVAASVLVGVVPSL